MVRAEPHFVQLYRPHATQRFACEEDAVEIWSRILGKESEQASHSIRTNRNVAGLARDCGIRVRVRARDL